jgi:hypothetical protein
MATLLPAWGSAPLDDGNDGRMAAAGHEGRMAAAGHEGRMAAAVAASLQRYPRAQRAVHHHQLWPDSAAAPAGGAHEMAALCADLMERLGMQPFQAALTSRYDRLVEEWDGAAWRVRTAPEAAWRALKALLEALGGAGQGEAGGDVGGLASWLEWGLRAHAGLPDLLADMLLARAIERRLGELAQARGRWRPPVDAAAPARPFALGEPFGVDAEGLRAVLAAYPHLGGLGAPAPRCDAPQLLATLIVRLAQRDGALGGLRLRPGPHLGGEPGLEVLAAGPAGPQWEAADPDEVLWQLVMHTSARLQGMAGPHGARDLPDVARRVARQVGGLHRGDAAGVAAHLPALKKRLYSALGAAV